MKKRTLKLISSIVVVVFTFATIIPFSFAQEDDPHPESPCWNPASLASSSGGASGDSGTPPGAPHPEGSEEDGDPVNLATGNYSYQQQDLFIPSKGLPLEIARIYNSLNIYEGPFGIGLSHNYDIFLMEVSNGSETYIIEHNPDGSKDKFLKKPDGSYEAVSPGCYDTLTKYDTLPVIFAAIAPVGLDSAYHIQTKHGTNYLFDLTGKLRVTFDRNQNKITLEYDSSGRLSHIYDTVNRKIQFSYNTSNKVATITDFTERTITYQYDSQGDLVSVTTPPTEDYPSGLTTTYSYDSGHRLVSFTDPKGNIYLTNFYDSSNRVVEQTFGQNKFYFTYDENLTTLIDRKGFKTQYHLNPDGTTAKKVQYTASLRPDDPTSYTTVYEYNENKEITKITYPKGNWLKYTYDGKGNILEIRKKKIGSSDVDDPVNDIVTTFTYEPHFNFIKTITDPKGNVTTYTYDYELDPYDLDYGENGNLIKITYPTVGAVTPEVTFTYNSYGQVETVTDPNGNVSKYEYYPDTGYLKKIVTGFGTPLQSETQFAYDAVGNVVSITDPRGNTTSFTHNELNQLIQITSSASFNYITNYFYDKNGNLSQVNRQTGDALNPWQSTVYTYTILDQLETITDDLGNVTSFGYDANGNRTSVQDAQLNTTTYAYDERDLLWKVTDALGNTTEYTYDKNGNLKEIKDANLNTTVYTYDDFGRLITTTYPNATTEDYSYDKVNNLIQKINRRNDIIAYTYDELNRLMQKSTPEDTIAYTYDAGSRLTDVTDSTGTISYIYDALNRVTSVTYPDSKSISYAYDTTGNRTKLTYPDSTYITYEYDQLNRLIGIKDQALSPIASYSYDTLSRRTGLTLLNGTSASYTYDTINRLTELTNTYNPTPNIYTYTYDNVGNRLTKTDTTGTETYTYDDIYQVTNVTYPDISSTAYNYDSLGNRTNVVNSGITSYIVNNLNQYTSVGAATYTYDTNGNLTNDATNTYSYDSENRLITASKTGMNATYTYDAFGRRIEKSVDSVVTKYVYDGDQAICEYDGSDVLQAKYVYGAGIDEPILMESGGETYYYHFDGLGSVTALSDTNGDLTESYSYDIFGAVTSSFSSVGNPYYFTGRRYDSETGLYYYRARVYNPSLGRFLQTDPVGYYAGMNLYTYVNNNPINWVDPLGLDKEKDKQAPEEPDVNWEPKNKPEDPTPEDPTPKEPTTPKEPRRKWPSKEDWKRAWEHIKDLVKEPLEPIEPVKDKSLKENLRVLKEMIEKLGPWLK